MEAVLITVASRGYLPDACPKKIAILNVINKECRSFCFVCREVEPPMLKVMTIIEKDWPKEAKVKFPTRKRGLTMIHG